MKKEDRIEIRVPAALKLALSEQAAAKGQTVTEYITGLLTQSKENFIHCPECKKVVFDRHAAPVVGKAKVKCQCGLKWVFDFKNV